MMVHSTQVTRPLDLLNKIQNTEITWRFHLHLQSSASSNSVYKYHIKINFVESNTFIIFHTLITFSENFEDCWSYKDPWRISVTGLTEESDRSDPSRNREIHFNGTSSFSVMGEVRDKNSFQLITSTSTSSTFNKTRKFSSYERSCFR